MYKQISKTISLQKFMKQPDIIFFLGNTLCRFFESFKNEYDLPTTENFHEVFRIHGVHNYYQGDNQFQAFYSTENKNRKFDSEFFRSILTQYIN